MVLKRDNHILMQVRKLCLSPLPSWLTTPGFLKKEVTRSVASSHGWEANPLHETPRVLSGCTSTLPIPICSPGCRATVQVMCLV